MARRSFNVISMSFLDAITCGFGAVILFFMIIAANVDVRRDETLEDLSSEVDRIELRVETGRRNLVQLMRDLAEMLDQRASSEDTRLQLMAELAAMHENLSTLSEDSSDELIARLREDLTALQREAERLSASQVPAEVSGSLRGIEGEGQRQYLTGLRMGGARVAILVDVSTSMLDRTLVNIIRRRNMSAEQQRRAPKWRQLVDTVDWLSAQMQPGMQFQVIAFNDSAYSLIEGSDRQWLTIGDGRQLDAAVDRLRNEILPSGPTSLHAAFEAARALQPKPDNIYLLVDGLPTMGSVVPVRPGVSSEERVRHFNRAIRELPIDVPVNVILLAMEGDPQAAPAYWLLALRTGGSMLAPAEDWP